VQYRVLDDNSVANSLQFVMFLSLANNQANQVLDLQSVGLAIHRVLQISICVT
jgi:hypothetical protein